MAEETLRTLKKHNTDPGEIISAMCTEYFRVIWTNDDPKHDRPDDDQHYFDGRRFCMFFITPVLLFAGHMTNILAM